MCKLLGVVDARSSQRLLSGRLGPLKSYASGCCAAPTRAKAATSPGEMTRQGSMATWERYLSTTLSLYSTHRRRPNAEEGEGGVVRA